MNSQNLEQSLHLKISPLPLVTQWGASLITRGVEYLPLLEKTCETIVERSNLCKNTPYVLDTWTTLEYAEGTLQIIDKRPQIDTQTLILALEGLKYYDFVIPDSRINPARTFAGILTAYCARVGFLVPICQEHLAPLLGVPQRYISRDLKYLRGHKAIVKKLEHDRKNYCAEYLINQEFYESLVRKALEVKKSRVS